MEYWKSRKVLVTGGAGFLGSYLVEELVQGGAKVTVVDNLSTSSLENLSSVRKKIQFIRGDLRDLKLCLKVTEGVEVVMNLASPAYGMGYSIQHHGEMFYGTALVQLQMFEAARMNKVSRFLVVSSSCVYPDDAPIPTPELEVMTGRPEKVNEGYGWAKRIGELQGRYYASEYGMEIAICRPFNPYGGRYRWKGQKSHVIPTLVKRILDGEDPLRVWGSGNQRRNFLHARDTARLMMMITDRYACAQPVNIGYEDDVSIAELVSLICEVSRKSPQVVFDTEKPEGRFRKCADATLLKKITNNYVPKISLRQGVQEMIDWYHRSFKR